MFQDIVIGRYRDIEDRITWQLERGRFEDALALAEMAERERRLPPVAWDAVVQVGWGGCGRAWRRDTVVERRRLRRLPPAAWDAVVQVRVEGSESAGLGAHFSMDACGQGVARA